MENVEQTKADVCEIHLILLRISKEFNSVISDFQFVCLIVVVLFVCLFVLFCIVFCFWFYFLIYFFRNSEKLL